MWESVSHWISALIDCVTPITKAHSHITDHIPSVTFISGDWKQTTINSWRGGHIWHKVKA